jgi:hypothetical protein
VNARRWLGAFVLALTVPPGTAYAQSVAAEADVTVGRSSEDVNAAAIQIRLFGATRSDWRFYVEGTWAETRGAESDAFGSAYPYSGARAMEAFGEKTFRRGRGLVGVRAGRYRTPFGISNRSDHAYNGFLRAPLIRYGRNWALSNNFLEAGLDVLVGTPALHVETSVGVPSDEGDARRKDGVNVVVRGQAYYRSLIVGVSSIRTQPSDPEPWVQGRMIFHGVDARWMYRGVQLRGEWIHGRPFDDVKTKGGYLDASVHHEWMGPVTAVLRAERLDYDADEHSDYLRRQTAGARVRLHPRVSLQVNVIRQPGRLAGDRDFALDGALTFSTRF